MPRKTKRASRRVVVRGKPRAGRVGRHNPRTRSNPGIHQRMIDLENRVRWGEGSLTPDEARELRRIYAKLKVDWKHQIGTVAADTGDKRALAWEVGRSRGMNPGASTFSEIGYYDGGSYHAVEPLARGLLDSDAWLRAQQVSRRLGHPVVLVGRGAPVTVSAGGVTVGNPDDDFEDHKAAGNPESMHKFDVPKRGYLLSTNYWLYPDMDDETGAMRGDARYIGGGHPAVILAQAVGRGLKDRVLVQVTYYGTPYFGWVDKSKQLERGRANPTGDPEDLKSDGYLPTILKSLDLNGQFYDVMREHHGLSFLLRRHDDGDLTAVVRDTHQVQQGLEVVVPEDQIQDVYHYALHHGTLEGWEPMSGGYGPGEREYPPTWQLELDAPLENPTPGAMHEVRTVAVRLLPGYGWEILDHINVVAPYRDDVHEGQLVRYYTGTNSQLAGLSRATLVKGVDEIGYLRDVYPMENPVSGYYVIGVGMDVAGPQWHSEAFPTAEEAQAWIDGYQVSPEYEETHYRVKSVAEYWRDRGYVEDAGGDLVRAKTGRRNPGGGFYVMKWGGGRYTSVAWYATREEAEREVARIEMTGAWSGRPPKVEASNPAASPEQYRLAQAVLSGTARSRMPESVARELVRSTPAGLRSEYSRHNPAPIPFSQLGVGEKFHFYKHSSSMASGPWVKTSPRKYREWPDGKYEHRVGTSSVKVIRPGEEQLDIITGRKQVVNPDLFHVAKYDDRETEMGTDYRYGRRAGDARMDRDEARVRFENESYKKWLHLYADVKARPQLEAEWRRGYTDTMGERQHNPADGADAADEMYHTFHGTDPTETVVVEEEIVHHGDLASLGDLEELVVVTPRGHKVVLDFSADPPLLCSSADGRQLHLRGGDHTIDLAAIRMNSDEWLKDSMVLGEVLSVAYRTAKTMDSMKKLTYEHKFTDPEGTNGGARAYPILVYDTLNNLLSFAGGTSVNLEAGIVG